MKIRTIRVKHYKNKSRDGDYVIMDGENGKKTWKLEPGALLDGYVQAYEKGLTKKDALKKYRHLFTTEQENDTKRKRYLAKLEKKGQLGKLFKKGSVKTETTLDRLATPGGREAAYRALLGKLIYSENVYNLARKNLKDLKRFFGYKIRLEGQAGPIGEFHDTGRYLIEDVVANYRGKLKYRKGTNIPFVDDDKYEKTGPLKLDARIIKLSEHNVSQWRGGVIQRVPVTIYFRK